MALRQWALQVFCAADPEEKVAQKPRFAVYLTDTRAKHSVSHGRDKMLP
ncbi:MAG TPA: hypothetical protein VLI46_15805 [Ramlibacter sp.]|nr:hypothetical protein [Ramlibacter sp.]